jgi:hypothetical protein
MPTPKLNVSSRMGLFAFETSGRERLTIVVAHVAPWQPTASFTPFVRGPRFGWTGIVKK